MENIARLKEAGNVKRSPEQTVVQHVLQGSDTWVVAKDAVTMGLNYGCKVEGNHGVKCGESLRGPHSGW